jgi:predicted CXXCH cytochrome family protein
LATAFFSTVTLSQAPQGPPSAAASSQPAPPRTFPAPTNLKVLPKDLSGQEVHDIMEQWAHALGARCDSCHAEDSKNAAPDGHPRLDFVDDSKPMKVAARLMYRMTEEINNNYIAKVEDSGIPVTCDTCHSGRVSPEPFTIQPPAGQPTAQVPTEGEETPQPMGEAKLDGRQAMQQASNSSGDCLQCHSDVKPQFSMAVHHKVEEGLIDCTDCHDAHGARGENALHPARWQFMVCTKCHAAAAGPFLYEHAAVKAEGCMACHVPHGGPNPQLLIQANVNTICLQCHLPSANSTAGRPPEPAHILSAQNPSCISCHSSIHGSNISDVFLKPAHGKSER